MKKISLKNLPIDSKEMLTKEQLKNVFGGNYTATGAASHCETTCNIGHKPIAEVYCEGSCDTFDGVFAACNDGSMKIDYC